MAKNVLGQYFTPSYVARIMVDLIESPRESKVLEPSAGEGVFLDVLHEAGYSNIEGIEIDSSLKQNMIHTVHNDSFVSWLKDGEYSVVIGNPPYIRWKNLEEFQKNEIKEHPLWGVLFNSLSDYLTVFIANAIQNLRDGGELIFITPSFWMHTLHSENLRSWMLSQGTFSHIINFGESNVFQGVSSSTIIFRFVKNIHIQEIQFYGYNGPRKVPESISLNGDEFKKFMIPQFSPGEQWIFADQQSLNDIAELEAACTMTVDADNLFEERIHRVALLGDYVHIANGMVSGLDKAFRWDAPIDGLNETEQSALATVVKGKDIKNVYMEGNSRYIDIPEGLTESDVASKYPSLYEQLVSYKENLMERYSYQRSLPFWEWAFKRSQKYFYTEMPKIFVPCKERVTNKESARFCLVPPGVVATQDVTAFSPLMETKESIEYILAYLVHPRVTSWYRYKGLMKGGIAEFSEKPLSSIPFRYIDWDDDEDIAFHDIVTDAIRESVSENMTYDEIIVRIINLFKSAKSRSVQYDANISKEN